MLMIPRHAVTHQMPDPELEVACHLKVHVGLAPTDWHSGARVDNADGLRRPV